MSRLERVPLKVRLLALGTLGLGAAGLACGGAKGSSNHEFTPSPNNPSPTATEMLPTATFTPEATATSEELKKLFDAPFQQTTADEVTTNMDGTYSAHADLENFTVNDRSVTKQAIQDTWNGCQFGDPDDAGKPELILEDRVVRCQLMINAVYTMYKYTTYDDLYVLASSVLNYANTSLPSDKFNELKQNLTNLGLN